MTTVSLYEAKAHLSGLISNVEKKGERVIICKHGRAVAEIVPIPQGNRIKKHSKLKNVKFKADPTLPTESEWEFE